MKRDDVCTGLGKGGNQAVNRFNHQVHVDWHIDVGADGLAHHGTNGQIGDVMIIHDVKVDPVSTGGHNIFNLFAQSGEVSG